MARDDVEVIIYAILKYLYDCLKSGESVDFNVIRAESFGIPASYWGFVIEELLDRNLIKGLYINETRGGKIVQNLGVNITMEGVEFLHSNSLVQKAGKTFPDIKNIIPIV